MQPLAQRQVRFQLRDQTVTTATDDDDDDDDDDKRSFRDLHILRVACCIGVSSDCNGLVPFVVSNLIVLKFDQRHLASFIWLYVHLSHIQILT